jgi:NAD(P)-dependent dehydrogenase (short-subunit alcohol dehydrogenase family)
MRLENQIAVVTGGSQGIGQQISLRLAEEGALVVIADINELGSWETAEMITKAGGRKAWVDSHGCFLRDPGCQPNPSHIE